MQIFLDYLPVLVFVGAYVVTGDPFVATAAIMVAMPVMLAGQWLLKRSVGRMHILSAVLVLALGTITLYLRDVAFIAWKPTVLNWLLAAVCVASLFIGQKPLLQRMLGEQVSLQPQHWRQLTLIWSGFFFLLGVVNLFVFYNYDFDTWTFFKLWGLLGLTLVFVIGQSLWLSSKIEEPAGANDEADKS